MTPLDALTARARDDLVRVSHPRMPWLEPRTGPDGQPALDVLIFAGRQGVRLQADGAVSPVRRA